jgi:protein-export membrane protein SecD
MKNQYLLVSIFIVIIGIVLTGFIYPSFLNKPINFLNNSLNLRIPEYKSDGFKLGLDLQGGSQLIYEADLSLVPFEEKEQRMENLRDLIERRIDQFGVAEPVVQVKGERLIVELAGVVDPVQAIKMIGETPFLEFKELIDIDLESEEEIDIYNKEALKKAEEILEKIKLNNNFEDLALEHSEDPGSKEEKGDLNWFKKGVMVPEFEEAVFPLEKGEIADEIVETSFGYHIIKKTEDENSDGEIRASHILIAKKSVSEKDYEWITTELKGEHLKTARYQVDPGIGIQIELDFISEGALIFEKITERNVGRPLAIFLDGMSIIDTTGDNKITEEDLYAPMIQEKITGGKAVITGETNIEKARQIAGRLKSGALPVPIKLISQQNVGASLGKDSLSRSLTAGLYGFLAVIFFMIIFYRLPGLLASISLMIYVVLVLSIFKIIPVTLSLSGIAGFILSIGMAIDANILVFSRMREELKEGLRLKDSIENSFRRAWPSIRDGNLTTLIVAFILFFIGTSFVKGFALTLIIGISISLFASMVITKYFLRLISDSFLDNKKFF